MRFLHKAFKEEFIRVLNRDGLTRTEAARRLGVSRQAFHAYLTENGSVPRKEVLRRIVEIWPDFCVIAGGQRLFDKDSLVPSASSPMPVQRQLELFEVLKGLRQENLAISVKHVGDETQVSVIIKVVA